MIKIRITVLLLLILSLQSFAGVATNNPIIFVTQFPISTDFATIGSTFANHTGTIDNVGRGGDLYIRYNDGTLRNLTREGGFGHDGFQDATGIAVRDPSIHWSGTKALFSMVIGAPDIFEQNQYYWQIYEITGFGIGQTINITKLDNQPVDYNNITPIYGSDGNIIFTSDLPRTKNRYNYPQKDEYESTPTNTGIWKLDVISGTVKILQHSPSGSFSPLIDSSGRLVFTRWDHLQRDQQASPVNNIGAFNYANENPGAAIINNVLEVFPEPRSEEAALLAGTNLEGHRINHFFPWQLNQDGSGEETLNHIGRHEFHDYFNRSINDDGNVVEFIPGVNRPNTNSIENTFMLHEDPNQVGRFLAIEAPEFATHNGGQIIAFELPIGARPDLVTIDYLTHVSTQNFVEPGNTPPPEHIGFSRDPITMSDALIVASHTNETRAANNDGTRANPIPRYNFRLKTFTDNSSGNLEPAGNLTTLGNVTVSYYDPDVLVSYTGELWELQAVEVVSKPQPPMTTAVIENPEQLVISEENVNISEFQAFLESQNLAVVVMRDVTTRESEDKQQPYNLRVAGTMHQTIGSAGQIYDVSHMQFLQGDQIRGSGGTTNPDNGQRVISQYLHDTNSVTNNINFSNAPEGSVEIYPDGSVALFVPAQRAMAWQSLAPDETPVVRERYWITFQPGEIRACGGCHGVNDVDQSGALPNIQKAQAFRALLQHWKQNINTLIFADSFED
jgi:hypothetical protein